MIRGDHTAFMQLDAELKRLRARRDDLIHLDQKPGGK
jgi:hypothetical protein